MGNKMLKLASSFDMINHIRNSSGDLMRTIFFIAAVFLLHGEILAQDGSPFLRETPIGKSESDLVCDVGDRDPYPVACWEGEQVVFLPAERGSVSRREDLEFARRAGSIADIVSAEEVRDGRYRIVLRDRADGRELSRSVGSDDSTLRGTALVRDIEAARELYLGDTLHVRRTSLNTYDPSVHRLRSFEVEFDARVSIQDIVVGWDTDRPLRVVVRTEDGKEGFVDVAWRLRSKWGEIVDPGRFEGAFSQNERVVHQVEYFMQRGDDLSDIAREYGVSTVDIRISNNLTTDQVRGGQVLKIHVTNDELYEVTIVESPAGPSEIEGLNRTVVNAPLPAYTSPVSAVVKVRITVDPRGRVVQRFPLIKTYPELEQSVMQTLERWRFDPLPSSMPQENQTGTVTFRFQRE